jgi:hypothetical protein
MAQMTPGDRQAGFMWSRRVTRALAAGAVALTGVFALVAAHANPGRKATTTSRPAPASPTVDPFASDLSDPNLAPPVSAPTRPASEAPPPTVVSGGS